MRLAIVCPCDILIRYSKFINYSFVGKTANGRSRDKKIYT